MVRNAGKAVCKAVVILAAAILTPAQTLMIRASVSHRVAPSAATTRTIHATARPSAVLVAAVAFTWPIMRWLRRVWM